MRLFLDASVILAACGSTVGASRQLFRLKGANGWKLIATPYILSEVSRNLPQLSGSADAAWAELRPGLEIMDNVLTVNAPVLFSAGKDKPVLFGALAWADVLLTLDRGDFGTLLGGSFYGLPVFRPGEFLKLQRAGGRLRL